jgi:peptide deformylase
LCDRYYKGGIAMAIRSIRMEEDPILRKKSREVSVISKSILTLIEDMKDTLALHNGLGIAAPQVGVLKRIIIVLDNNDKTIVIINPTILESKGTQRKPEGCLSVRNVSGIVERPQRMKIKGLDINGNEIIIDGNKRLATVLSHEIDHLEGVLFIDKIIPNQKEIK